METYTTNPNTARFGGACYNICVGSYFSSYRSPPTSLLLKFIKEFYLFYLTGQLPGNDAKNVGCYNVLNNSPNIQLSTEVGKLRVDTKYMRR